MMQFQRLSPCGAPGLHRVVRRIAAWGDYAIARRASQTLVLFCLVAALTLIAAACGGDEPLAPGGTEITERAERQATVVAAQQQAQQQTQQAEAEAPAEQQAAPEQAAEAEASQQAQQQAEAEAPGDVEDDSTDTITLDETVIEGDRRQTRRAPRRSGGRAQRDRRSRRAGGDCRVRRLPMTGLPSVRPCGDPRAD